MVFNLAQYLNIIQTAEDNQATVEGRLARLVCQDVDWPYSDTLVTQQTRVAEKIDGALLRYSTPFSRGYDVNTLQTIVGEWMGQAGGRQQTGIALEGTTTVIALEGTTTAIALEI